MDRQLKQLPVQGLSGLRQKTASPQATSPTSRRRSNRSNSLRQLASRSKQAAIDGPFHQNPVGQAQVRRDAASQLLQILGITAGLGVGARSLMGIRDSMQGSPSGTAYGSMVPEPIKLYPPPRRQPQEDELEKVGYTVTPDPKTLGNDVTGWIAKHLIPNTSTLQPLGDTWGATAAMGVGGAGLLGGWKLTDWLLKQEKARAGENEVDQAEDEYRAALGDQYRAAMMAKQSDDALGLCELADDYAAYVAEHGRPKQAFYFLLPDVAHKPYEAVFGHDNWKAGQGAAYAAMALLGAGAAKGTYDWAKAKNKQKLMQKALKMRARQRAGQSTQQFELAVPENTESEELPYAA